MTQERCKYYIYDGKLGEDDITLDAKPGSSAWKYIVKLDAYHIPMRSRTRKTGSRRGNDGHIPYSPHTKKKKLETIQPGTQCREDRVYTPQPFGIEASSALPEIPTQTLSITMLRVAGDAY